MLKNHIICQIIIIVHFCSLIASGLGFAEENVEALLKQRLSEPASEEDAAPPTEAPTKPPSKNKASKPKSQKKPDSTTSSSPLSIEGKKNEPKEQTQETAGAPATPSAEDDALKFNFSGFILLEQERVSRFGEVNSMPSFRRDIPSHSNLSLFSNLNFEVSKGQTSAVTIVEIGEIYAGDSGTGGAVGARYSQAFELRNLYLAHEIAPWLTAKGGIITTGSDPRSFIFNDHIASIQASYKTSVTEGLIWFGDATRNRQNATTTTNGVSYTQLRNQSLGIQSAFGEQPGFKATAFGLYQTRNDEQFAADDGAGTLVITAGDSHYLWAGTTLSIGDPESLSVELTGIGNWGKFSSPRQSNDQLSSYLVDLKATYLWANPSITFGVEGLATPGAANVNQSASAGTSTATLPVVGRRKNFISPVAASYLMTIATSDGVDEAAGTPKSTIIAPLNLNEGLRLMIGTISWAATPKLNLMGRYGHLLSAVAPSNITTTHIGDEIDFQSTYALTSSASLQLDYAMFFPGAFYSNRNMASLAALRYKLSF